MKIIITEQQIKKIMNKSDWKESSDKLTKTFYFKDYNEVMSFVNSVMKIANKQNHHPDITVHYDNVKLSITDHDKGGVSEKCHKLVKSIDNVKNEELTEYSRTLKNARQQGVGLKFPKSAINSNPSRFREYNK
jgi:4a-hydroxytetrahydrobiopterin dehydratase